MELNAQNYRQVEMNITGASYVGRPVSHTVMYAAKKIERLLTNLEGKEGCLVFIEESVIIPSGLENSHYWVRVPSPQKAYAAYVSEMASVRDAVERSLSINLTAQGYYLCEDAVIGENAWIEPGVFIGPGVVIGDNAVIRSGASLRHCVAGDNLVIGERAVIGTNGFTMTNDDDGNKTRIPTLGRVVIGNDVEIGASASISRGSAGDTVIEDHVKIDALVYIGHDDHIYKNVEIPGGVIVAGFVEIHENVFIGVNSSIRNRIEIGEGSYIGMGSTVVKSVPANETYVGNPARPIVRK